MHLLEALLGRRHGLDFNGIIDEVPGYSIPDALRHADTPEAKRAKASVRRTFERDKDELRDVGIPLQMARVDDEEYVYSLKRSEFYLPYLAMLDRQRRPVTRPRRARGDEYGRLTEHVLAPDVLAVIVEGAVRAAEVGDARLAAAASHALRTLALDLPVDALRAELGRNQVVPAASDPTILDALDLGVVTRQRLRISYHGMRDAEPRARVVEPLGLFLIGNTWYLAAREAESPTGPVKNFRVSRIDAVVADKALGTFVATAEFDLLRHAQSRQAWDLGDGEVLEVDVRFTGTTGVVQAAAQQGEAVDGRPEIRRFRVRRADAFVRWVVALAPQARIVAPAVLVDAMRTFAAQARAHHAGVRA